MTFDRLFQIVTGLFMVLAFFWRSHINERHMRLKADFDASGARNVEKFRSDLRLVVDPLLETHRGEVRRAVELDLKSYESALRLTTEYELRLFDHDMRLAIDCAQALAAAAYRFRLIFAMMPANAKTFDLAAEIKVLGEPMARAHSLAAALPTAQRANVCKAILGLEGLVFTLVTAFYAGQSSPTDVGKAMAPFTAAFQKQYSDHDKQYEAAQEDLGAWVMKLRESRDSIGKRLQA